MFYEQEQELVVDPSQSGIKLGDEDSATSSPATCESIDKSLTEVQKFIYVIRLL